MSELLKAFAGWFWEVRIVRALLAFLLGWNLLFCLGSLSTTRRFTLLLIRSLHGIRTNRRGLVVSTTNCHLKVCLSGNGVILNFTNLSECSETSSGWHRWLLLKDWIHRPIIWWNQRFTRHIWNWLRRGEYYLVLFLLRKKRVIQNIVFDCNLKVSVVFRHNHTTGLILAQFFCAELCRWPCRILFDHHF